MKQAYEYSGRLLIAETKQEAVQLVIEEYGSCARRRLTRYHGPFDIVYDQDDDEPRRVDERTFCNQVTTYGGGWVCEVPDQNDPGKARHAFSNCGQSRRQAATRDRHVRAHHLRR